MPRVSKVEACMLCDEVPCICNAKPAARKRTSSRPRRPGKNEGEQAKAVGPGGSRSQQEASVASPSSPARRTSSDDDLVLAGALRVLQPILHTSELDRYSGILGAEQTLQERKAFWKARREDV